MKKYQLEICANSIQSALNAEKGGADRIELCDNLWEGGTTPSIATIELTKQYLRIPVFTLIRPRGGDFVYSDIEFELMKQDIIRSNEAGADGIVSGVLLADGSVDVRRTEELVKLSDPLPFTFHRAFDQTPDPLQALEAIIQSGVDRILTSGQQTTALEGILLIHTLLEASSGQISIVCGGGITCEAIPQLADAGCREFHLSARSYQSGIARYPVKVPMNGAEVISETELAVSDVEKIRQTRSLLDELIQNADK
jgi:copper homeostasis protein